MENKNIEQNRRAVSGDVQEAIEILKQADMWLTIGNDYGEPCVDIDKRLQDAINLAMTALQAYKEPTSEEAQRAIELLDGKPFGTHNLDCDCVFCNAMKLAVTALRQMKEPWISVNDRLPENEYTVLFFTKYDGHRMGSYMKENWETMNHEIFSLRAVTHWQPLPEPPMQEVGENE